VLPVRSFTAIGARPYIGFFWAEMLNWGPLTNRDNAYDDNEDVNTVAICSNPTQRFICGGELRRVTAA
jgi:hypothetical protein